MKAAILAVLAAVAIGSAFAQDAEHHESRWMGYANPISDAERAIKHPPLDIPKYFKRINPTLPKDNRGMGDEAAYDDQSEPQIQFANMFRNFSGGSTAWFPPDPVVASGIDRIIVAVNSDIFIRNKNGGLIGRISSDNLFGGSTFKFDPRVAWDPWRSRFLLLYMAKSESPRQSFWALAVSKTTSPTAVASDWHTYFFSTAPGDNWGDYGYMGFDENAVFLSCTMIPYGAGFRANRFLTLNKDEIYSGLPAGSWMDSDFSLDYMAPAQMWTGAGRGYIVGFSDGGGSQMKVWRINWTGSTWAQKWANSPGFTRTDVSVPTYIVPPNATQPGGLSRLDTGDTRVRDAVFYNGTLYTVQSVAVNFGSGNRTGYRAYRVNAASPTTFSHSTSGANGFDCYYPAIFPTSGGDAVIVFGRSSSSEFASLRYTTWRNGVAQVDNSTPIRGSSIGYVRIDDQDRNRFGDYFGAALDPWDLQTIWVVGEYVTGSTSWDTWVAETNFKPTTTLTSDPIVGQLGQTVNLRSTLRRNDTGAFVAGQTIQFKVNGLTVGNGVTDSNGVATVPYTVPMNAPVGGLFPITATFERTTSLNGSGAGSDLFIRKRDPQVVVTSLYVSDGQDVTLFARLQWVAGPEMVAGKSLDFYVRDVYRGSAVTDAQGLARLPFHVTGLPAGSNLIRVEFAGDAIYNPASANGAMRVEPPTFLTLTVTPTLVREGRYTAMISATLRNSAGQPINAAEIEFFMNGQYFFSRNTSFNGQVSFTIQFSSGHPCGENQLLARFWGEFGLAGSRDTKIITVRLAEDLDMNGIVDDTDLAMALTDFGTNLFRSDVDKNGIVDDVDLSRILERFGHVGC